MLLVSELDFYAEAVAASLRLLPSQPRVWLSKYGLKCTDLQLKVNCEPEYRLLINDHKEAFKEAQQLVEKKSKSLKITLGNDYQTFKGEYVYQHSFTN